MADEVKVRKMEVEAVPMVGIGTFKIEWLSGEIAKDDIDYSLDCGAGCGSPYLFLRVTDRGNDKTVYEQIDIRDMFRVWVGQVLEEMTTKPE